MGQACLHGSHFNAVSVSAKGAWQVGHTIIVRLANMVTVNSSTLLDWHPMDHLTRPWARISPRRVIVDYTGFDPTRSLHGASELRRACPVSKAPPAQSSLARCQRDPAAKQSFPFFSIAAASCTILVQQTALTLQFRAHRLCSAGNGLGSARICMACDLHASIVNPLAPRGSGRYRQSSNFAYQSETSA